MARYFKGKSVTGPVEESPARNFREVVEALRLCPTLGIKRSAFLALPKPKRNELKQVPFFVPATFKTSPSKRNYENALVCNLIFIDIDELPDGVCPARPFVQNPELLYTALEGLSFAAHTTASSTAEKPRMRIVVDADNIPIADYPKAVATIAARLGLTHITKESMVATQPMFLCTMFADSTDEDHPLIAHRLDGEAFTREDIATPHGSNGRNGNTRNVVTADTSPDALFFLRAQVPEISLDTAQEALSHIDADCPYLEWLEVAAALKHQFTPHKEDEAYALFDEWSATGTKYVDADDTKAKWDSLRPTPVGRMPVTIRTLLKRAAALGWDDSRAKDNSVKSLSRWMDEAKSITDLVEHGVKRILATPLLSPTQEDMMVDQLRITAKGRFAFSISKASILKEMKQVRDAIKEQSRTTATLKEPVWAKGVCYVSAAQQFYRHRTGEKYSAQAFDALYSRHLLPTAENLKEAGIAVTPAALSKPIVKPTDYALNHLKLPTTYDYEYDPSQPTETFFVKRGRRLVNTYAASFPEMDSDRADGSGRLLQLHLCNLVAEPEYRQTLVDFMAFMVQFPGRKIRWAVLIQSVDGAGKTYLANVMSAVLGQEHVKIIDGAAIRSGFNEWSFGHQMVVLEEVRVRGSNKHEIMNALKPLITNDTISVNEKFRSQRVVDNISNYMAFSNHHDALALAPGDRRWFVIKSPLQEKSQVLALGEDYFPTLFESLKKHPGAMRAYLSEWVISDNFRADGHAPRTKYVDDLINDSASDLTAAVRRLIHEGDHPLVQYDIVGAKAIMDMMMLEEGLQRPSTQYLHQVLREEGLHCTGRHSLGGERQYVWARNGVENVVGTAAERLAKGAKNLHMELLF